MSESDKPQQAPEIFPPSEAPPPAKKPGQKYRHKDWQPLGTVRDYFNEQIKQDQNYR